MATKDSLIKAVGLLEEAWIGEKASKAFGDDVLEHIERGHIEDEDVIGAAYQLRRSKTGRQGFPSINTFCDTVDAVRSQRKASEAQGAARGSDGFSSILTSVGDDVAYATRLYGRALLFTMKGIHDEAEAVSSASVYLQAHGFSDDGSLLPPSHIGKPTTLQIAVNSRKQAMKADDYDPFAED